MVKKKFYNFHVLLLLFVRITAYLRQGGYNVFIVDWGKLTKPPCYMAAVHNLRSTAHCVANHLSSLRLQGLNVEKTTCVGHSLGIYMILND